MRLSMLEVDLRSSACYLLSLSYSIVELARRSWRVRRASAVGSKRSPSGLVRLEHFDDLRRAERVGPEEQAAFERRKADAEDQAEVDVAHVAHDLLFEHARRFEQHRQEQSVGDLLVARTFAAPRRASARSARRLRASGRAAVCRLWRVRSRRSPCPTFCPRRPRLNSLSQDRRRRRRDRETPRPSRGRRGRRCRGRRRRTA